MKQEIQDHLRVAGAASANVPLAGANTFFTGTEPILQWLLLVVQLVVALASAYYIFRKAYKKK